MPARAGRKPALQTPRKCGRLEGKDGICLIPMLSGRSTNTANDQELWLGNTEGRVPLGCLWVLRDRNENAIAFRSMPTGEFFTSLGLS